MRVKYAGIGFADVMAVRGGYPLAPKRPFSPGYEFFGQVEKAPDGYSLMPGTRVAGMLPRMAAYREEIDVDPRFVVAVPPEVSDEMAAALPLNYLTAYALMSRCVELRKGQTFLIHGAAGGVGTAALEIARVLGLRAFGTASPAKHDLVRSLGGVPLHRQDDAWMDKLRQLQPEGVDAAFDSFGAASMGKSWKALAHQGTLVCYGLAPSAEGGTLDFVQGLVWLGWHKLLSRGRRVRICGTLKIVGADPTWFRASLTTILGWARDKAIRPLVSGIRPWNKVMEAHLELAQGHLQGKLLLDFSV